jgi:hypothetical protein
VDAIDSEEGLVVGSCEYGDEPSGSGATEILIWFVKLLVDATTPEPVNMRLRNSVKCRILLSG